MPTVQAGEDVIEFPDSMSQEDIQSALHKRYAADRSAQKEELGKQMVQARKEGFIDEQGRAVTGAAENIAKALAIPAQPILKLPRSIDPGVLGGVANVGAGLAEGLSAPAYWMLPGSPVIKALTAGQMAGNLPRSIPAAVQTITDPNATTAQKIEAGANPVIEAGLSAGLSGVKLPEGFPKQVTEPMELPPARPLSGEAREFQLLRENWLPTIKPWRRELLDKEVAKGEGTDNIETNFDDSPGGDVRAKRYYQLARKLYGRQSEEQQPTPIPNLPKDLEKTPPTAVTGEETPAAPAVSEAKAPEVAPSEAGPATPSASTPEPDNQLGSVTTPDTQALTGPQMGAAGAEEIPPTGAGGEKYGISQRLREERAQAGQVDPIEPGTGINPQDAVARGNQLLDEGFDVHKALEDFEKTGAIAPDGVMAVRQYGEKLAAGARNIEEQFGTDSEQFRAAQKALNEWDSRSKPIATALHKGFVAHQGETDIDTGSFSGLERAYRAASDKDIPESKTPKTKKIAADSKEATDAVERSHQALADEISKKKPPVSNAEKAALDAAWKTVRENAVRISDLETKSRVADSVKEKESLDVQIKAAQKATDAANKVITRNAADAAREAARRQADPSIPVWEAANKYLEQNQGLYSFDDIRNKIATDLGMSVDKVTRLMSQDSRVKRLADDLWNKQRTARRLKEQAKSWITSIDTPRYQKALAMIPRAMFSLKVGLHGTVALGTHAPFVAFQPRFWNAYVRNFGKMYHMVFSPAYYERQIQDLVRRPNYPTARRAGLINDPFQYEEYHTTTMRDMVKNWIGEKNMDRVDKIFSSGNRGYAVLKILRQDMFDQMWNKLPRSIQVQEGVAAGVADGLNHVTGVTKGKAPRGSNLALFAPRLEASRVMWLGGDPARAAAAFANWKNAPQAEKTFAINQAKEKAWVFATFASMLALNQGILSASGSKQKINGIPESLGGAGFDPLAGDFLKFKAAGADVAYGGALLTMAKLPARVGMAITYEGKGSKYVMEDERVMKVIGGYLRTQMSPFAGTTTDLALGRDFMERPLPAKLFGTVEQTEKVPKRLKAQGIDEPYTWGEYAAVQLPMIPVSEGIREAFKAQGMSDDQTDYWMKALAITAIMAGTGTRITEDTREQ